VGGWKGGVDKCGEGSLSQAVETGLAISPSRLKNSNEVRGKCGKSSLSGGMSPAGGSTKTHDLAGKVRRRQRSPETRNLKMLFKTQKRWGKRYTRLEQEIV